jgi:hypothetical protein
MFLLNKNLYFFLKIFNFIYCLKSEINFYINNVPSLFRCQREGPLFYFNHFPTDNEFNEILRKNNIQCDLSLSSINRRTIIELNRLELLCEFINKKEYINNFLFLSLKCSTNLCRKYLPSSVIILNEYKKNRIDLFLHHNSSIIVQLTNDRVNLN